MTDTLLNADGLLCWRDGLLCWRLDTGPPTANSKAIYARPFGIETSDLDVDFSAGPRPVRVTQLLRGCLRSADGQPFLEDDILGWTLTRRLQGVLAIVMVTKGRWTLVPVRCPRASCLEQMELELDLTAFLHHDDGNVFACTPERDINLRIRLPTGYDQMNWLRSTSGDSRESAACMATTMVAQVNDSPPQEGWLVPESWLQCMESALMEHDPFTVMELDAECPNCGHTVPFDIDLEDYLLCTLSAVQQSLMDEIHRLASAYHWSEGEILSLSPRRRQYYLGRIVEGGRL